ncbi:helix-turn-helix domain-containing protein [Pseudomonas sp. RIT-To-2]
MATTSVSACGAGALLADVAVACGFFDQTHLARHFSRVFGTTPGAYG